MFNYIRECFNGSKEVVTHYIFHRLVETHHTHYYVWYPYGYHWYKIRVPRVRGPMTVLSVRCSDDTDVTESIMACMGPSYNFHGIPTTPRHLGYSSLTFELLSGDKVFTGDEVITLRN